MTVERCPKQLVSLALLVLVGCSQPASRYAFKLDKDPSDVSIYGFLWSAPTEEVMKMTPLLDEGEPSGGVGFDKQNHTVFTANALGLAFAFDMHEGTRLWRFYHDDPFTMPPFFVSRDISHLTIDLVIEGSQNGRLIALNAETGAQVWSYDMTGELRASPTIAKGRLIVTNSRNMVGALDPATGKFLWQYAREFPVQMAVLGHSGATVVGDLAYVGFSDGVVVAINVDDGVSKWSRPLTLKGQGFADADATPQVLGGRLYAASFEDGLYALNPDTGEVLSQMPMQGVTQLAVHDPYLFVASSNGQIEALEAETSRVVWKFKFPVANLTPPVVYRGYVAFGARPGGVYVLDENSGRLIQMFHPGGVGSSTLAFNKGALGLLSENSFLYVLRYGLSSGAASLNGLKRYEGL